MLKLLRYTEFIVVRTSSNIESPVSVIDRPSLRLSACMADSIIRGPGGRSPRREWMVKPFLRATRLDNLYIVLSEEAALQTIHHGHYGYQCHQCHHVLHGLDFSLVVL